MKQILIGAIGCNIAWGVIDAVMFMITGWAQKGRDTVILNFVRKTREPEKALKYIAEIFPAEIATTLTKQSLEQLRKEIVSTSPTLKRPQINGKDLKMALGVFLLVFLTTIPIAIPFILMNQVHLALRISNFIAIVLLFLGGWILARYGGYNKLRTGFFLALIGVGMVLLTISLGG